MSGDRHNSHVELLAQGVANLVVPFVGGKPATGAIARTATNIKSAFTYKKQFFEKSTLSSSFINFTLGTTLL